MNVHLKTAALALGLGLQGLVLQPIALQAAPSDRYRQNDDRLRDLIDRTQTDLREASELNRRKGDERKRYQDAQGHLSSFDRKLTKGKFDKSELDKSIDKIKDILDKNVLQASSRDALLRDMSDLKVARARRTD